MAQQTLFYRQKYAKKHPPSDRKRQKEGNIAATNYISIIYTKISVHHNFVSEEVARLAGGGVPFGQRAGVGDHDADCLNV